jgi:hypothetical protein
MNIFVSTKTRKKKRLILKTFFEKKKKVFLKKVFRKKFLKSIFFFSVFLLIQKCSFFNLFIFNYNTILKNILNIMYKYTVK